MIVILDDDTIQKIAAGEVVERPASVVKELVENSIDAGAKRISISFTGGGKDFISVADDGEGMTEEDARLSFLPHSTSKIKSIKDIRTLATLGFRGEALSSIAKVSIIEIHTKKEENEGIYLRTRGGNIEEVMPKPREVGTTVTVRNLFFNVPARRKFLKSDYVEGEKIKTMITRIAIAYPEISFSLLRDRNLALHLEKNTPEGRINELFGDEVTREMIYIAYEKNGINLSGYISLPEYLKERGRLEYTFVNKRPIRSGLVRSAVKNAYAIPTRERSPSFILNLSVDKKTVDVNVHPRKEEVRFADENFIYGIVFDAVRKRVGIGTEGGIRERGYEWEMEPTGFWQLHDSYIFAQTKTGVLIIDQHAAHERILYEKIIKEKPVPQKLLFPLIVVLSAKEYEIFTKVRDILATSGFEIEKFGERTVRIASVSSVLKDLTGDEFKEMLYEIRDAKPFSDIARTLACRGAIKQKNKLSPEEMNALIDDLFATENPYFCPHGRPTMIKWSIEELSRRFGR
jgi:DNA mismatch repair protein MutL